MNRYLYLTFIAATGFAHSAILIQDNFDGASTSASIDGRTPSLNLVNSNNWVARPAATSIFGNGSGGISMDTSLNQMGGISLGAGYFTTNPGIYQLSYTISHPSNYGASWVGFGFSGGLNTAENFTHADNAAGPWMLYRANGQVIVRANGPGGTGLSVTLPTTYAAGTSHTFMFELDASNPQWSYNLYVDGVAQDLNGATSGTAFTYGAGSNPAITNLAIGTGFSGTGGISTGDNLTFALVPEPSHAVMLVVSAGMLALRRRRC
jgi:hypothetical protein